MKPILFLIMAACFLAGCNGNNATTSQTAADSTDTAGNRNFFPVADFVGGQIRMVDSLQLPLTLSITRNGRTEQRSLSDQEFKTLAAAFRKPDINDPSLKKYYKETSLADQSIPSITFSYATEQPGLEIRKLDVIIKPDPVRSDKVNTIYMEKSFKNGDTTVRQKLYWKAGKNFQLITEKSAGSASLPAELVKVVWDPTE